MEPCGPVILLEDLDFMMVGGRIRNQDEGTAAFVLLEAASERGPAWSAPRWSTSRDAQELRELGVSRAGGGGDGAPLYFLILWSDRGHWAPRWITVLTGPEI